MSPRRARITALGRFVPERILTNADLEKMVDTNDEWIRARTGIVERHLVEPGTPASVLATKAAQQALELRGISASEIDLIIVATISGDMAFPSTACIVQDKLGANRAWAFDVAAACSGFVYALTVAAQFVENGTHKRVLVIGADVMSSIVDYTDRATCILFGDAAAAVLLEPSDDESGILGFVHEVDGSGAHFITLPAGGSALPTSHETVDKKLHYIRQDGKAVFKYAVRKMAESTEAVLAAKGFSTNDLNLLVAHQANARIIDAAGEKLGLRPDQVIKNIDRYGNTTAATIPLAMCTALDEKRLKAGDLIVIVAVGAGFTVGATLIRWSGVNWK
jgi:3-oxoacyl-[acyl-carrier-protein] synthase III